MTDDRLHEIFAEMNMARFTLKLPPEDGVALVNTVEAALRRALGTAKEAEKQS